jgi:hypothetical protein
LIELTGPTDSIEYTAATTLRERITATWPDVATRWDHIIALVAAAKCYGQRICDIDLILFLDLTHEPRSIAEDTHPLMLASACATIEIKDHDPASVRFIGNQVEVRYHGRWHNVSEQSFKQRFALKGYLEAHRTRAPWIVNLIWLRNVPEIKLPNTIHNIIGSDTTWETLLERLRRLCQPHRDASGNLQLHARGQMTEAIRLFTEMRQPALTPIEERKVTNVIRATTNHASPSAPKYIERLGTPSERIFALQQQLVIARIILNKATDCTTNAGE